MKLIDLTEGIEIVESTADFEMEISSVSYDSRTVRPGGMFVAVKGFESDGHDFIEAAIRNGASCILCEKKPVFDVPYVRTVNMRRVLSIVSANWFGNPARQMKLIGVTGTNGKTTTTNLVKQIIETCSDQNVGLIGTNRNMIGETVFAAERTTPESYEIQKLFRQMADERVALMS